MNENLLILGAGQYGKVVKEIAESIGEYEKIVFLDDAFRAEKPEKKCREKPIGRFLDCERLASDYAYAVVAVGNASLRKKWTGIIADLGYKIPTLVSPFAYVSKSAQLGCGDVIEPMCVVHANAVIGIAAFISAGAVVNHDSHVSDFCHINCNSVVMSNALVPPETTTDCCEVFRK